ncbi:unnamed protein product [Boreogadus saida]
MEGITQKKVCSFHFKPEDFELNVLGTKRVALLNTAIPSVFTVPYDDEQPGMSTTSSAKRMCLEANSERTSTTNPPQLEPFRAPRPRLSGFSCSSRSRLLFLYELQLLITILWLVKVATNI